MTNKVIFREPKILILLCLIQLRWDDLYNFNKTNSPVNKLYLSNMLSTNSLFVICWWCFALYLKDTNKTLRMSANLTFNSTDQKFRFNLVWVVYHFPKYSHSNFICCMRRWYLVGKLDSFILNLYWKFVPLRSSFRP